MPQALREICGQLPVIAITQCDTGSIDAGRYAVGAELIDAGVIDGGDMTLEAALAKLAFALDAGLDGEGLRAFMEQNIAGERSS
jgi:L-asparaginase